ncbi:unnamed protein product [Lactuca virosa]|uniref:CCR4-Not complex component Not N-terminal domain-containing protein n=1 Tax=Lactuca virosa TaxID=75947 RepID=A0AAU9N3H8_9ASTR|nr:unnamed protein product [Lactuca virosa]
MGASRKLQSEIDRVLKKVQESVDVFDRIWNKVYDTDNAYQRERFEADLKKEIKKLQRYRDQIKTWIQSSEIKDKKVSASYEQALMDARKLIEREMERFRICEKDTKTKAFSKERLGQQPKWDYKEKAKSETRDWLNNTVSELESQIDGFEAEMEGLSLKKGKTWPPRLRHLESSIARHKAHILKLELILRLLDNDELSPELVNDVKDFTDDYVERNQEDFDEFEDVDMLYDILQLDKVEALEDFVISGTPGLIKVGASMNNVEHRLQATSLSPVIVPLTEEGKQKGYKVGANTDTIEQRFQATCQLPVVIPLIEERKQIESQPFIQVVANMDKVEQRLQATNQLPVIVPLTEEKKQIESHPLIQAGTSMDNTEQRLQATCQLPITVPPEEVIKQNGYKDFEHLKIPLRTLVMATNNFSKETKESFHLPSSCFPRIRHQVDFLLEVSPHLKLLHVSMPTLVEGKYNQLVWHSRMGEIWQMKGQIVIPIFYDVNPSEVRKQKRKYGEAFANHELENKKKIKSWRQAFLDDPWGWLSAPREQIWKVQEDLAKHELENKTKIDSWRRALVYASNISGWEPQHIANG